MKKYRNILKENKNATEAFFPKKITDHVHITVNTLVPQTITEIEASLSHFNKKTLDFGEFKEYIQNKNIVNNALKEFYQNKLYRKQKLSSYVLRNKSEQKMINHFKEKYGKPDEVVIGFGDFEQKGHMKYKEPVKGKGFRNLFRKAGYEVLLVDEYRTSCRCSNCESDVGICETFRYRENPRPWKNGQIKVYELVKCKTCSRLWNRDVNASRNICKIAYNEIRGIERPSYLKRSNQVPINEDIAQPVLPENMNIVESTNKVTLKRRKTVVKKT